MPRRSRIVLSGIPVHIIQRGNNRQSCFHRDEDRRFYLFHLARLLPRMGCALHAYCLMTNHVHLLLTPDHIESCGRLMKHLGQLHTQFMNRTYYRTGTLWEGRFRSCIVQSEEYALACYRYIEMNPVRAGLVNHPAAYEWSSYEVNAGGAGAAFITPHEEYQRLGTTLQERREAYGGLFALVLSAAQLAEIRNATNGNFALGLVGFKQRIAAVLGRRVERGAPGRPASQEPDDSQMALPGITLKNVVCP